MKSKKFDPTVNIEEQRRLVLRLGRSMADVRRTVAASRLLLDFATDAARLAELVAALDKWLTNGGSAPSAWQGWLK